MATGGVLSPGMVVDGGMVDVVVVTTVGPDTDTDAGAETAPAASRTV